MKIWFMFKSFVNCGTGVADEDVEDKDNKSKSFNFDFFVGGA